MGNLSNILGGPWSPTEPDSPEIQLARAMSNAGLEPTSIHMDGNLHRFPTDGSKDAGWYVAYGDKPQAAVFGSWKTGEQSSWVADIGHDLTAGESMAQSRRIAELRIKRDKALKEKQHNAANTVQLIWDAAGEAVDSHSYLVRKGVKAHGLRITGDGRLIAPLFNTNKELTSLQYISIDGSKQYHAGGAVKGSFMVLGTPETECFIVEGYATGATVYEATGKPVIIAYSANNLVPVTESFKDLSVTIIADLDENGIGQNYANQAGAKYGARVIVSPVPSDVNDYVQGGGDLLSLIGDNKSSYKKMQVFSGDTIDDTYTAPDEIIEDLITSNTINMLYGASHSGKTFFAIALAVAISNGDKFFGKHTDKGNVVYLATEAPRTVRDRLQAIKKYIGTDLSNFYVVPMPLNFYANDADVLDVINLCKEIGDVKLVIGDTLARMSAGANENSGEDMAPIMEKFDTVSRETESAVLIIHHSGKNTERGSRGWSGMPAHIDAEIEITDTNGAKTAKITKQRELGTTGLEIPFKLKSVEMGKGKFGSMKTSCIVEEDHKERVPVAAKKNETFFRVFTNAWYADGAQELNGSPYLSRSALKEKLTLDKYGTERTIQNNLSASYPEKIIGMLLNERTIESKGAGWIVINPEKASVLMLSRKSPKSPKSPRGVEGL